MASPQEIISDLLNLSPEERAKIHEANPTLSSMVKAALEVDPDYAQMPELEKSKIRSNLGFPKIVPMLAPGQPYGYEPPLGPPTPTFQQRLGMMETQQPELPPILPKLDYYRKYWQDLLGPTLAQPIRETLAKKTAPIYLPGTNIAIADVGKEGYTGSLVRGTLEATPLTKPLVPREQQEPSFLSVENAAQQATSIMLTSPLFFAKGLTSAIPPAKAFFQMFLRYPGLSNAVATASVYGGPVAAYSVFSNKMTQLIQDGTTSIDGLALEFGEEYAGAVGALLGFHGAIKLGVGTVKGVGKGVHWVGEKLPGPPGEFFRGSRAAKEAYEAGQQAAKQVAKDDIIESIAQDIGEAPRPQLALPPAEGPTIQPTTGKVYVGGVYKGEKGRFQRGVKVEEKLPGPGQPGYKENVYPKSSEIYENVAKPANLEVKPDGSLSASIPENAVKAGFVSQELAIPGDVIYYGEGKVAQVLERLSTGFRVKSLGRYGAEYFVPSEKVVGKAKFTPGQEVILNGEPVIIDSIPGKGNVRVVNSKGTRFVISEEKISTKAELLSEQETAERISMGIKDPAPEGESVFQWLDGLMKDRPGFFKPGVFFGGGKQPPANTVPIVLTTQPDPHNLGSLRYAINPAYTYLRQNTPEFNQAAKMRYDAKREESIVTETAKQMLQGFKDLVGSDDTVSKKLFRFLIGLPRPGERLTADEKSVISTTRLWMGQNIIPIINKQRAVANQPPVPPNYNPVFHLLPETILTAGAKGQGVARVLSRDITPLGIDNLADAPWGKNVRIDIDANFWSATLGLVDFLAQNRAWEPSIQHLRFLKDNVAKSSAMKKFISWDIRQISGKSTSPDLADAASYSVWVEKQIANKFGTKGSATLTFSNGKTIELLVPPFDIADANLSQIVRNLKTLNYAAMIGFNMRTILLNLTQPVTTGLAQIPGSPLAASFDLMGGYVRAFSKFTESLFRKDALKQYFDKGVLHDLEDLYDPSRQLLQATKGGAWQNSMYAKDWMMNNILSLSFMGMRAAEIVNRVTVFEGHQQASQRFAKEYSKGSPTLRQAVESPDFQDALSRFSAYASNVSNFLYGKGFRTPLQTGFVPSKGGGMQTPLGALGEALYTFNTFTSNHLANMTMLLEQNPRFGGHMNAAARMAAVGAPAEFANYLKTLEPYERRAFLKALVYQQTLGTTLSSALGLASIAQAISPIGMALGFQLNTVTIQATLGIINDFFNKNIPAALETAKKSYIPLHTFATRAARGGTPTQRLLGTKRDIEGKEPQTYYEYLFGRERVSGAKQP